MGKKFNKKNIFIIGAYGCGNRGDDAILEGICHVFPNWNIKAFNGSFEDVSTFLPVRTVLCRLNEGASWSIAKSLLKQCLPIAIGIAQSSVVLYGGGGTIHDLTPYNLPFMFMWHVLAKLLGKKVYYFSIGIGPIKTRYGRFLCKTCLSKADGIYVRDNRGIEICQNLGIRNVKLTADAAFLVQRHAEKEEILRELMLNIKKYICVTASEWFESENYWAKDSLDFSAKIQNLEHMIQGIYESMNMPIVFVPTVARDERLGNQLRKKLRGNIDIRICPADWNTMKMSIVIENGYMVVGMRMHSIIMAARTATPFIAIIYDEKVRQLLMLMEMEKYGLEMNQIDCDDFGELLKQVVREYDLISCELKRMSDSFSNVVEQSAREISSQL